MILLPLLSLVQSFAIQFRTKYIAMEMQMLHNLIGHAYRSISVFNIFPIDSFFIPILKSYLGLLKLGGSFNLII